MIRLSRAGRKKAIKEAIRTLQSKTKMGMFTKGEICKQMGIKSTSKIRDILQDMCANDELVKSFWFTPSCNHEVAVYGLPIWVQMPLPEDRVIYIDGVKFNMLGGRYNMGKNRFDAQLFRVTLKVWRKMHQLTQQDVGNLTQIATSTYSFIETGDRAPTMAEFSHLCDMMDMDAKDFFVEGEIRF